MKLKKLKEFEREIIQILIYSDSFGLDNTQEKKSEAVISKLKTVLSTKYKGSLNIDFASFSESSSGNEKGLILFKEGRDKFHKLAIIRSISEGIGKRVEESILSRIGVVSVENYERLTSSLDTFFK